MCRGWWVFLLLLTCACAPLGPMLSVEDPGHPYGRCGRHRRRLEQGHPVDVNQHHTIKEVIMKYVKPMIVGSGNVHPC